MLGFENNIYLKKLCNNRKLEKWICEHNWTKIDIMSLNKKIDQNQRAESQFFSYFFYKFTFKTSKIKILQYK